jgi:hypothetical protein
MKYNTDHFCTTAISYKVSIQFQQTLNEYTVYLPLITYTPVRYMNIYSVFTFTLCILSVDSKSVTTETPTTQLMDGCPFVSHGTSLTGVSYYNQIIVSASECRKNCFSDVRCNGYTHKSSTNHCRLHDTTQYQSTTCPDCSFYSKICEDSTTRKDILCM